MTSPTSSGVALAASVAVNLSRSREVDTVCGIMLDEGGVLVTLHDTGAPDQPNCPRCLSGRMDPALRMALEEVLERADAIPATVRPR